MSTLSYQVDSLRLMARLVRDYDYKEISRMLRKAADTIESLRDSLNEVADKWAEAQIKAEDYAHENMLLKCDNNTRWYELFGTPERAARTLAVQCFGAASEACDTCVFGECDGKLRNSGTYPTVYDALLEWLRGDA